MQNRATHCRPPDSDPAAPSIGGLDTRGGVTAPPAALSAEAPDQSNEAAMKALRDLARILGRNAARSAWREAQADLPRAADGPGSVRHGR
jgi:hypothetical protein